MRWVFLRGLAREQRHWGGFPRAFERLVPGASVTCLDLPGAGTERERPSPTTITAIVEDLRERWARANGERGEDSWGLLGMSLGGMVAMDWCARHPRDFERLVVAGSSAADLSPPWRRFDLRIVPTALSAMAERDPARREAKILSMTTRTCTSREAVAAEWASYPPMRRRNVARQLRAASTFRAPRSVDVPMLVVAGAGDPLADPACSRALATRFGAPLRVHPTAGHELALDAPEWFASEVRDWLVGDGKPETAARVSAAASP